MIRVLVIGANSYIGRKFREYIMQSNNDISVDLVGALDGSWRQIDFSNYNIVLHLAAIVHKKETKNMKSLYYKINYNLAVEVAKKAKENHISLFIFMSTAAVFGSNSGCISNKSMPAPISYYGKSKFEAEKDIYKLLDEDFCVAIVRPPMVYGEGCKGNYARLVRLAKLLPIFPNYHNKRSMLYIDNLSIYLVGLIKNKVSGYFHPQDDEYTDTCEMFMNIRKNMGRKTILIPYLNFIIKFFVKNNISICHKLFGDFYYDKTLK